MNLFSKPIAQVYVDQVRKLDSTAVPIFSPDTQLDVGSVGSFEDGRFIKRGDLQDRGIEVPVECAEIAELSWESSGSLSFGPSVEVPGPLGQPLVKATATIKRKRSVALALKPGVERSVPDADAFGERLMELWASRQLRTDRVVVWAVRRAPGGTVIVARDGDTSFEVTADAAAVAAAAGITLSSLSVGVTFGAHSDATWTLSAPDTPLVLWARLFRLDPRAAEAADALGFEATEEVALRLRDEKPQPVEAGEILDQLEEQGASG